MNHVSLFFVIGYNMLFNIFYLMGLLIKNEPEMMFLSYTGMVYWDHITKFNGMRVAGIYGYSMK